MPLDACNDGPLERPLPPYRVLDLTDESGAFCGKVLADLGAEVIKLEPPHGDPSRRIGPFAGDAPSINASLPFWAVNTGKLSATLDIFSCQGRALFLRLVDEADFLIESFRPGALATAGLDYEQLRERNPRLVMVSITPFGQRGPYAAYPGGDLIAMAAGGLMQITGDLDRPPVRVGAPQSQPQAGAQAATGALIAHRERLRSGLGQHVDVSAQEAMMAAHDVTQMVWAFRRENVGRGARTRVGGVLMRSIWRCADGYISWRWSVGRIGGPRMAEMIAWMVAEGDADLAGVDWPAYTLDRLEQQQVDAWESAFAAFFLRFTRAEIYRVAREQRIFLMPVNTVADLVADEQLQARRYVRQVDAPTLAKAVLFPGPLFVSDAVSPQPGRPPRLGEHNVKVYQGMLGLSELELAALYTTGVV